MIRLLTTSLLLMLTQVGQASTQIGSVAIYSDGTVKKLLQNNEDWALWEDQRKRQYKEAKYPHWPVLQYQKFPDIGDGYLQELVFGIPHRIKPIGDEASVTYELVKTSKGTTSKKYWRCSYDGQGSFKLGSKKYKTHNYDCARFTLKKDIYPHRKEQQRIKYSPTLELVVDRKRVDSKGKTKRIKLVQLLPPEKVTAKRIARTVYKLRNDN